MSNGLVKIPLTFPLPPSDTVTAPDGKWYQRAWTAKTRMVAERGRYKLVTPAQAEAYQRAQAWRSK